MIDRLSGLPLAALVPLFAAGAAVVWVAGSRLSGYVEAISERTGLGDAFLGALMLGGITSLPELATSITASVAGDARLAANNLLGGVAMQVVVLAAADLAVRRRPLSGTATQPVILLQGVLLVALLAVVIAGIVVRDPLPGPVGLWSIVILTSTLLAFAVLRYNESRPAWRPITEEGRREREDASGGEEPAPPRQDAPPRPSVAELLARSSVAAAAILVAGVVLSTTGEAIAGTTGLGSSFFGAVLLAFSTSLPEVSTTVAAARLGRYDMAFSNVLGANILDIGLLAVVDLAYAGPPILSELGPFGIVAAALGILLTTIFLAGLLHRSARAYGGAGADSLAVVAVYLGGIYLLFTLR